MGAIQVVCRTSSMDIHFAIAITLAVLAFLWGFFKFFFWIWVVGKGCQLLGNHIQLQEQQLQGRQEGNSFFSNENPKGYGTPISQWTGSLPVERSKGKPNLSVIPGGKR